MTTTTHGTRRLLSASALMASGTLVSRILGFARVMLAAFVLGNGTRQADMYSLALMVPTSLYILFAGGALNTVLVPQIVRAVTHDPDGGEGYTNRIMTAFLLIVAAVALIVTLAAPAVVWVFSSAEWRVPALSAHYHSMVALSYLCLPQVFFYGAFFLIGQVLNARDSFGPMMWAPIANNVVAIAVLATYVAVWGSHGNRSAPFTTGQVLVLGVGSTLGILAQTLVLLPYLRRTGFRFRPRFDFRGTGLGHTFALAQWTLGFVAVNQLALVVVNRLATSATASGHGAGLTVYNNAYLIWILPHSLITVSLATAMLPAASRRAAEHDLRGVEEEVLRTIRLATTLLLPMAAAFVVFAFPLTRIAFGQGQGAPDAHFVAWTLIAFAIGLVPFTIQYLCLRAFYALEDTRATFQLQVIIAGLNAALAWLFVVPWHRPGFVAAGLALAYSLAYVVGVALSITRLRRTLTSLDIGGVLAHLARLCGAVVPAGVLALLTLGAFGLLGDSMAVSVLGLVVAGALAVVGFVLGARALNVTEVAQIVGVLRRRRVPTESLDAPPTGNVAPQTSSDEASPPMTHPGLDSDGDGENTVEITEWDEAVANVQPGQVLGHRYRLEELLVRRGSTLTWRAFDTVLARSVLMHLLAPHDPLAEAILAAARQAAVATDSRFLRVLDAVESDDDEVGSYIVCEYAPGESLENLLAGGPLSALEAAWVVRELSDALAGMHTQRLYHRELNPDTVIITATGNLKIVGFLIEAALLHDGEDADSGEATDVQALGKLLYAALVSRWPGGDCYGMAAAPTDGDGQWLTPRQVKHGVSPSLDSICERILRPPSLLREVPLTTAAAVCSELTRVLGTADAAHDLERRMRYPVKPITTNSPRTWPRSGSTDATHVLPVGPSSARTSFEGPDDSQVPADGLEDTAPFNPMPYHREPLTTASVATPSMSTASASASPARTSPGGTAAAARPRPRRWVGLLIGLVLVVLVASLIVLGIRGARQARTGTGATSTSTSATASSTAVPIVAATDFDPTADGGSGDEHSGDVRRAYDNNAATRWTTMTYQGSPKLGRLKPGVGIVLDLGKAVDVRAVTLSVSGAGTDLQIRVPSNPDATTPPMATQKDWTTVASGTGVIKTAALTLKQPARTRFVLVYLTSLPAEKGGYVGGVYEVKVAA